VSGVICCLGAADLGVGLGPQDKSVTEARLM